MSKDDPRIVAAAQAKVDFYDDLRGYPSEWTELEYGEAEAGLKAADAWDTVNGVCRVALDDSFTDRLADALHEGDIDLGEDAGASSQAIILAVLTLLRGAHG
jgi:hypothetical protein